MWPAWRGECRDGGPGAEPQARCPDRHRQQGRDRHPRPQLPAGPHRRPASPAPANTASASFCRTAQAISGSGSTRKCAPWRSACRANACRSPSSVSTSSTASFLPTTLDSIADVHDGVAVARLDHPAVREAINALAARGVTVVTLVSDVPGSKRVHYAGSTIPPPAAPRRA